MGHIGGIYKLSYGSFSAVQFLIQEYDTVIVPFETRLLVLTNLLPAFFVPCMHYILSLDIKYFHYF